MWKRITLVLVATAPLLAYACKPAASDSNATGGTDAGGKGGRHVAIERGLSPTGSGWPFRRELRELAAEVRRAAASGKRVARREMRVGLAHNA